VQAINIFPNKQLAPNANNSLLAGRKKSFCLFEQVSPNAGQSVAVDGIGVYKINDNLLFPDTGCTILGHAEQEIDSH